MKFLSFFRQKEADRQANMEVMPKLSNPIDVLVIADTHGCVNQDDFSEYIRNIQNIDLCLFLGDHTDWDMAKILNVVPHYIPKAGILGNHDYLILDELYHIVKYRNYLEKYEIYNLNGEILEINGITFTGIEGSFAYKSDNFLSFSQEESIAFCRQLSKADILVSHDISYRKTSNTAHQGLKSISEYISNINPIYHIHGHIHEDYMNICELPLLMNFRS